MRRVYQAADLAEAHLLARLLECHGIDVHIFNQNALGALGEIPFTHAWPELWVDRDDDRARAMAVIEAFEASRARDDEQVQCRSCCESNPGSFDYCWSCGASLDGA